MASTRREQHATADTAELLEALRERAPSWGQDRSSTVDLRLVRTHARRGSRLHFVDVLGPQGGTLQRVVVKIPLELAPEAPEVPDRPRLLPLTARADKHRYQYRALAAAHGHFSCLPDARTAVVKPIDHLPSHEALVLEDVQAPTLRDAVRAFPWPIGPVRPGTLARAFLNAGLWLRRYHDAEMAAQLASVTGVLRSSSGELVEAVAQRADYIAARSQRSVVVERLLAALERRLRCDALPSAPVRLCHGDFAPRNMFVGTEGEITVFDLNGRWRAPIYDDVAFFMTWLRTSELQVLVGRPASPHGSLARYEQQFLRGYFGAAPVPAAALAPYLALALLDRWVALLSHHAQDPTDSPRQWRSARWHRSFSASLDNLVPLVSEPRES